MKWLNAILEDVNGNAPPTAIEFSIQHLLVGYHWQYVPSCIAAHIQTHSFASLSEQHIERECKQDLIRMLRPDGFVKVAKAVAATQVPQLGTTLSKKCNPPAVLLAPLVEEYLASYYCTSLLEYVFKLKDLTSKFI